MHRGYVMTHAYVNVLNLILCQNTKFVWITIIILTGHTMDYIYFFIFHHIGLTNFFVVSLFFLAIPYTCRFFYRVEQISLVQIYQYLILQNIHFPLKNVFFIVLCEINNIFSVLKVRSQIKHQVGIPNSSVRNGFDSI